MYLLPNLPPFPNLPLFSLLTFIAGCLGVWDSLAELPLLIDRAALAQGHSKDALERSDVPRLIDAD